jgi:aminopeptidase-like protein
VNKLIEEYFDRLWPINRSITGDGVRETLKILSELVDLNIYEIPSGTRCFDWVVPDEWNVEDAYILTPSNEKIASLKENNLHLMGYSIPIDEEMTFDELEKHLFTIPEQPDAIPYLTSYYSRNWKFCIKHNTLLNLPKDGIYKVVIKSTLAPGHLTIADAILPGESEKEILLSSYICHPSLASNELSGPLVLAFLYQELKKVKNKKYTYRFVFTTETIGTIAYLSKFGEKMKKNTLAGYVLTCLGDKKPFTYKKTRTNETITNLITEHILSHYAKDFYSIVEFTPIGSDERQYCSAGFNLPVGSLMRTMYNEYIEYHTSLDNKDFISFEAMEENVQLYLKIIKAIELNDYYINLSPYCEPQLGKRGLYPNEGTKEAKGIELEKIMYLLNYCDGKYSLLDISKKLGVSILELESPLRTLIENKLIASSKF